MILSIERKTFNVEIHAEELNRTPVNINNQLKIDGEEYHIQSIVYHQGTNETVYGHYTCHCLIDFQPLLSGRGRRKDDGQWFKFNDGNPVPLSENDATSREQVKKRCSFLFYQKRNKKMNMMMNCIVNENNIGSAIKIKQQKKNYYVLSTYVCR